MTVTNNASIEALIESSVKKGNLDPQLAEILSEYKEPDLGHFFQIAYRLCLESGNIQLFATFYLSRRNGRRSLPDAKLLRRAIAHSVEICTADLQVEQEFRQLNPQTLKALFEMLVWQQMIAEFLEFYQDLGIFGQISPKAQPDADVLFAAIQITEQRMNNPTAWPAFQDSAAHRQAIKRLFNL